MAKNNLPTKKTVFFIVEGNTDKTALETIFKKIYKPKDIRYAFTNGDLTSDEDVTEKNILDKIYDTIKPYMQQYRLKKSDIWQIVQIFDTDGTYIPETAIVTGPTKEFTYSTTEISCKHREKIIDRNTRKSELMDFLLKQDNINDIPYCCYFMSSNLDHALYGKQNLTDEEKKEHAFAFNKIFEGKEMAFIEYLKKDVVNGVPDSYPASWRYIKEDLHSLERHTNLHIYFLLNPIL